MPEVRVIPEKVEADMLRIRKGATAAIKVKRLEAVMAELEGWVVEKDVILIDHEKLKVEDVVSGVGIKRYDYDYISYSEKSEYFDGNEGFYHEDLDNLKAYIAAVEEAIPALPAKPKRNKPYLIRVDREADEYINGADKILYFIDVELAFNAPIHRIKAPNGEEFIEYHGRSPVSYDARGNMWKWLKENGLIDDILKVLGMEEHVEGAERTRENTGTCPVCLRNIKLKNGFMVRHGYTLNGYGGTDGMCFGHEYKPYEESSKGTEDYLIRLEGFKDSAEHHKSRLEEGEIKKLTIRVRRDNVEIGPDHNEWDYALKVAISNVESEIRSIDREIASYKKLVDEWVPRHLPEVGSFGMGKPK